MAGGEGPGDPVGAPKDAKNGADPVAGDLPAAPATGATATDQADGGAGGGSKLGITLSDPAINDAGGVTLDTTVTSQPIPQPVAQQTQDVVVSIESTKRTDYVRAAIAFTLLAVFAAVLAFAGFLAFQPGGEKGPWGNGKDFLSIVLPAVTGLLGSAIGFYFGSRPESTQPTAK
jgi:hypothetical protein